MYNLVLFNYYFKSGVKFFFNKELNKILFWNTVGYNILFLNNYYFFNNNFKEKLFLFINKAEYIEFIKNFFSFYNKIFKIFYFKIIIRGLGYKIRKVTKRFFLFFFAVKHYFYFYIPNDIFIKIKGRRFYILCYNKMKLNNIFFQLLYLKKMDFYVKNKIFFLKKLK
jgi:hypothetical protein